MKLLIHLANVIAWLLVPCVIVFILSFAFGYSYWAAIQNNVFAVVYFMYAMCILPGYLIASEEDDQPLSFIKTNKI